MSKQDTLVSFESGHYKSFKGEWLGDSVWGHHKREDGSTIHINKDKVEYIQTKPVMESDDEEDPWDHFFDWWENATDYDRDAIIDDLMSCDDDSRDPYEEDEL